VAVDAALAVFGESRLRRCGVFVNEPMDAMLAAAERLSLSVIQLHGEEGPGAVEAVRKQSGLEVWKAVRPRDAGDFLRALEEYCAVADGLLLDGWAAVARGGTGARFPWKEVAEHRWRIPGTVRFIAAGGLGPDNVAEAAALLRPDVVDVSSGVERSPGIKEHSLIRRFAAAARSGAADPGAV